MNQLSYITTLCLCLLCSFIVVIHADTTKITETTTNVDIVSSTIEVQQEESSNTSPTKTSPNNNDSTDILPSPTSITNNNSSFTCHVIGECVPCDIFEVKLDSYCKEFGNKEPIECQYDTLGDQIGPLPIFQACKRVKRLERTRYLEFQFINILIAFMSCSILLWRRRKLAEDRFRKLSRRIRGSV